MSKEKGTEYLLSINDKMILLAVMAWHPAHADAPTESELDLLREIIKQQNKWSGSEGSFEMLSLNWLRNRFVALRKAGKMKENKG